MKKIIIFALFYSAIGFCLEQGDIALEKQATRVGEALLVKVYGKSILSQRPFKISSTKETWILEGTFHCPQGQVCLGGVAFIEFRKKDGNVVKVIHGK